MRATARTHQGKVRPHNEDCVAVDAWVRWDTMPSAFSFECRLDEPRLSVVADGLGGHAGGEVASRLVARHLAEAASRLKSAEEVEAALNEANKRLFEAMESAPQLRGMGATVVGLLAFGSRAWLFNVGDSRGYVGASSYLRLLSIDDSTSFRATDERTSQRGNSITQSLGGTVSFTEIKPHIVARGLEPGDRYLLCSDGLTDMLDQDAIERCLTPDPWDSVEQLVSAALAAGGEDNISVVILDFPGEAPAPASQSSPSRTPDASSSTWVARR
jgi:PPM family protein phosphatase